MKIVFFGGDERARVCAARLADDGHDVRVGHAASERAEADACVLPLPVTRDGKTVAGTTVSLADLAVCDGGRLLGGLPPAGYGITDWYTPRVREAFDRLTAEGAIRACLGHGGRGLGGARVAVLGYGRLGRALASRLRALGAVVVVGARSGDARAAAQEAGLEAATPQEATAGCARVFNTIPARVLGASELSSMRGACIYELAGTPCADDADLQTAGVRVLKMPGVPGVYAPVEAGEIMAEAVASLLGEEGTV